MWAAPYGTISTIIAVSVAVIAGWDAVDGFLKAAGATRDRPRARRLAVARRPARHADGKRRGVQATPASTRGCALRDCVASPRQSGCRGRGCVAILVPMAARRGDVWSGIAFIRATALIRTNEGPRESAQDEEAEGARVARRRAGPQRQPARPGPSRRRHPRPPSRRGRQRPGAPRRPTLSRRRRPRRAIGDRRAHVPGRAHAQPRPQRRRNGPPRNGPPRSKPGELTRRGARGGDRGRVAAVEALEQAAAERAAAAEAMERAVAERAAAAEAREQAARAASAALEAREKVGRRARLDREREGPRLP